MRTEEPRLIRLQDYRAPDWAVETVDLDVSLHATATKVRATLKLRPNTDGAPAPLVLDGQELKLVSLAVDGKPLPAESFLATPEKLTIAQPPNRPFRLEIETLVDPAANTQLMGLYRAGATYCTQCEAEGFRRITYFPDRPDVMAVYTTRIEADKAEAPILLSNGNLTDPWRRAGHTTPLCGLARSVSKALLPVRTGRRRSRARRRQLHHHVRPHGRAAHLCRARQGGSLRLRHGKPQARHALGRDRVRARIRSRHVHDRRRVRLQHGGHGEQGPQHLQRQIRAWFARDGDRHRFHPHRGDHRARIFPQLDRQPHHLPRLVSALPEGGADGLPRPGVHRRHALATGRAHQRRSRLARAPVRRGRRAPRPSGAAGAYQEINNFYTAPSTKRARRSCA